MKILFEFFIVFSFASLQKVCSVESCHSLQEFQRCLRTSKSPEECAFSSGCRSALNEFFDGINDLRPPTIFSYTRHPSVKLDFTKVGMNTLDHSVFRSSSTHFPLSVVFSITRDAGAGDHNVSLMMPTLYYDSTQCSSSAMSLFSISDYQPGNYPFSRIHNCQLMKLTNVCVCFVSMQTEAGTFVVGSTKRHPLSPDAFDNDLRRRLGDESSPAEQKESSPDQDGIVSATTDSDTKKTKVVSEDKIDVSTITHTALVILTIVAFIGNGIFLTCVFCVSAV